LAIETKKNGDWIRWSERKPEDQKKKESFWGKNSKNVYSFFFPDSTRKQVSSEAVDETFQEQGEDESNQSPRRQEDFPSGYHHFRRSSGSLSFQLKHGAYEEESGK
jgi:hypothetical protein